MMKQAQVACLDHRAGTVRERPVLAAVPSVAVASAGYRAGRGVHPVALAASLGIVATITAGIALVGAPVPAHHARPLAVFQMELAPPPPPPPAATAPATPPVLRPVSPPPVVPVPPPATSTVATVEEPTPPVKATVQVAATGPAVAAAGVASEPQVAGPIDGGDLSAKMIAAPAPSYPDECRRRREQGIVKLRVLVGLDGHVDDVSVASSSGSTRLDKAALGAVRRWRWAPMRRDGAAVMVSGFVTIPFVLRA